MSKVYIASTLAAAVSYTGFAAARGDNLPQVEISVTIAGGAGVANKRTIVTPRGVITEVTPEQAAFLKDHYLFKEHVENGYISILPGKPADPDDVAADMNGRDTSSPIVPQDYSNPDEAPAAVGAKATGQGGKRQKG